MVDANRLKPIDGLRGIAILSVMGFHYLYSCAPPLDMRGYYPYGATFAISHLMNLGRFGVHLFFLISGFVIALTLEKCSDPLEFYTRRFARLWPALIVISVATFALLNAAAGSPYADQTKTSWLNFLPSLTLTPPEMWGGLHPELMDHVYWTLVVEVRFYLFAGIIYWGVARSYSFATRLAIIAILNFVLRAVLNRTGGGDLYTLVFIPGYLPWFAAGALFYEVYCEEMPRRHGLLLLAPLFLIIAKTCFDNDAKDMPLAAIILSATFFATFWLIAIRSDRAAIFSSKWLVSIGAWSYSIYLLHQSLGLIILSSLPKGLYAFTYATAIFLVSAASIFLGYLSFRFIEVPSQRLLMWAFRRNFAAA